MCKETDNENHVEQNDNAQQKEDNNDIWESTPPPPQKVERGVNHQTNKQDGSGGQ
jgi:hypothetical protein